MKKIKELALIVLLALLVRIPWIVLIPHIEAPDENTHFWVIKFIVNNFAFPNHQAVIDAGSQAVYGSIPQLGYLPHIIFLKVLEGFISTETGLYIARLGSLLMGLVVVGLAYYFGQILFTNNRLAALALPLVVAFHPQFVFVTSYINNDSTTAALSSVILLLLILALKNGLDKTKAIWLSVFCSWLILSKYSGYCTLITTFFVLLLILYRHKADFKRQIGLILAMAFTVLLFSSWWFVRNYYQFAGDITGVKTMHSIWTLTYHRYLDWGTPLQIVFTNRFWRMLFFSFWGWFGYMTRSLPRAIYYGYLGFVIIAFVRFIRFGGLKKKIEAPWIVLILSFVINLFICIYGTYSGVAGPQGRYLFPSEISIMAMLIAGLGAMPNKWSNYLVGGLIVFNAFVYFYSSFYLFKLYS